MPLKKSKNGELASSDEIMKLKYTSKVKFYSFLKIYTRDSS